MNSAQLEEFVSTVNQRVQDCIDATEADRVFLDSLDECRIDQCELGEGYETEMGDWYWWVRAEERKAVLIQYRSGRCAIVERIQ